MLTGKQIALLHIAAQQLGLDDETYRAVLIAYGGAASAKELSQAGFKAVMAYFTNCGFRSTWTKRTFGNRPGRASPSQVELIRQLWHQYAGSDDETALNKWLHRSFHASALRFLTPPNAGKAIEGLKAMIARKARKPETVD